MGGFGWRHEFRERSWLEVRDFLGAVSWRKGEADYLFEVVDSVISSGADELLAVTTSMHDIVVTLRPPPDPPMDVVVVRSPSSLSAPAVGEVRIDCLARSGGDTTICRPVAEAVSLFWRFMQIEYGIASTSISSGGAPTES